MESDTIVKAVLTTLDPKANNEERNKCFQVTEEYKQNAFQLGDLSVLCGAQQHPSVVLFGLKCLEHKIKHSWSELGDDTKSAIKGCLFDLALNMHSVITMDDQRKVAILVLTHIFVYLIKCEWPQRWPSMLDDFYTLGNKGPTQSHIVLSTLLRLYEDVMQFQDVPQPRRRDIISTLNDNLPNILSFALEIICNQLRILKMQGDFSAVALCREAISMLSGFLDSCRMDAVFQWKPNSFECFECGISEFPFLDLLKELIQLNSTRSEALDIILLLLKRKPQNSEDLVAKLSVCIIKSLPFANRLATLPSSLLTEQPNTEIKYNSLLCLGEILARLGCTLVSRWKEFGSLCPRCDCLIRQQPLCSYQCSHLLDSLFRISTNPAFSRTANSFWLAALASSEGTLLNRLQPFVSDLLFAWRNSLQRPTLGAVPDRNYRMYTFFDAEDGDSLFNKCRVEALRCLNLAAEKWPSEYLAMLNYMVRNLLQSPVSTVNGSQPSSDPELTREWDILETLVSHTLNTLKEGFLSTGSVETFDNSVTSLVKQLLQNPLSSQPELYGKQLTCACSLMQFVDSSHDSELLLPLLTQLFSCFRPDPSYTNSDPAVSKPLWIRNLHMAVASAFFRLTKTCPDRIMAHFTAVGTEVTGLWTDPYCGMVEKCVLLEALILLCLRLPQPIEVQQDLLKQLVSHVTLAWVHPPTNSTPAPMSALLNACTSGGSGLLSFLGLDQPLSAHQDTQSVYVQMRIALTQNVLALLAATRRLSEPVNSSQLHTIAIPLLEPVMPAVLLAVRAFNELWLPENRARVHPELSSVFEMPGHLQHSLLSLHIPKAEKRCLTDSKSPIERIRSSLYETHDNILTILSCLFEALFPRLYSLSTDQLSLVLHQSCCAAFDHLSDYRVNILLRLIIRQYIRCCPKEYFATALAPLLGPILESVVQRLDTRWNQLLMMSQTDTTDGKAVTKELVEERIARLLGRSFMDLLRLIYSSNGFEFSGQSSEREKSCDDGSEDVHMGVESSSAVSAQASDSQQIGSLAQVLLAQSETESRQQQPALTSEHCADPLFLCSLAKSMTWPDSSLCLKASQWIPALIDGITSFSTNTTGPYRPNKRPLPGPLAEKLLFGVLYGLHLHGKNAETNLPSLLVAGHRIYAAVEAGAARARLRDLLFKVLMNATEATESQQIMQNIQNFEAKLFDEIKPLADKAKREIFKKVTQPIIGVPLSERFRDPVTISNLAPLRRSNWKQATRNGDFVSHTDNLGIADLFSG